MLYVYKSSVKSTNSRLKTKLKSEVFQVLILPLLHIIFYTMLLALGSLMLLIHYVESNRSYLEAGALSVDHGELISTVGLGCLSQSQYRKRYLPLLVGWKRTITCPESDYLMMISSRMDNCYMSLIISLQNHIKSITLAIKL